jgi:hypothetical protein
VIKRALNFKCHPFIFGLYRIALGGFLLLYMLLLSNRWIEFFGPYGISPIKLRTDIIIGRFSLLSYLHTETSLWIFYALTLLMTLIFILGRGGKLPALFLWLTLISIQNSLPNNVCAEEFALCVFAFYGVIMPVNSTLVFDFKQRKWSDVQTPVPAWALIPFFVHMELIYIISLPLKPYFDHAWIDGNLVYFAVNTFDMSRFPGWSIFKIGHAIVSKIMTWSSLIVEGAFPVLVWTRFRVLAILAMISFQVGIAIMLSGVQMFSLSMILGLILFLPSKETRDLFI